LSANSVVATRKISAMVLSGSLVLGVLVLREAEVVEVVI
jgi:hypothetical protein